MAEFHPSRDYFGEKYKRWDGVGGAASEGGAEAEEEPEVEDVTDMLSVCDSTYSRRSARKKSRAARALARAQEEEDEAFKKCYYCREIRDGAQRTCEAYCGRCPAQDRAKMSWAHVDCLKKHGADYQVSYGAGETMNTAERTLHWSCPKCLRVADELRKAAAEREASLRATAGTTWAPRRVDAEAAAPDADDGLVDCGFDFGKWDAALKGDDAMDDDEREAPPGAAKGRCNFTST